MRLLAKVTKAKLAAKRIALKGPVLDLPLQQVKPSLQKSVTGQISLEPPTQDGKKAQIRPRPAILPRRPSPRHPGVSSIKSVKAKVMGIWPMVRRLRRLKELGFWASSFGKHLDYGTIEDLRGLLGLPRPYTSHSVATTSALPEDAFLVSFDTEFETREGLDHVVEIGVTVLDTRDIVGTAPGPFALDWFAKAKTHHYVVDTTQRSKTRMGSCHFSDGMFADVSSIKSHLFGILQRLANPPYDPNQKVGRGPRKVVLVGHSIWGDLIRMRFSPGLELDLLDQEPYPKNPIGQFDTLFLTERAIREGAEIPSAELGRLASWLGIPRKYRNKNGSSIGCHNAGNDAAYTMMALLIYAVRWESVIFGKTVLLPSQDDEKWRALRSASELTALRQKKLPAWANNYAETIL
jgi:hypothetical protein